LPPTDQYLEWSDALSRALLGSLLLDRLKLAKLPLSEMPVMEEHFNDPRKYIVSARVIVAYEEWLYGPRRPYDYKVKSGLDGSPGQTTKQRP